MSAVELVPPKPRLTGASLARHRSEQTVATPEDFLSAVSKRFGLITFDLAANLENSVAINRACHYSVASNALVQDWTKLRGTLFLNPPFGNIAPWARKCRESAEAKDRRFDRILLLVPASIGSNWFADYVHGHAMVHALTGRVKFVGHEHPFPKDLILAEYGRFTGFDCWSWRDDA